MINVNLVRQETHYPDKRSRHQGRAWSVVDGKEFSAEGPAPVYRLVTLLYLHGYADQEFEVHDDRSPTGREGGLAMRGRVRNWAYLVKGKPSFTRKAQPDRDFTPDEMEVIAQAAGTAVGLAETPPPSGLSVAVCATRPPDGPGGLQEEDRAPAGITTAPRPEAA